MAYSFYNVNSVNKLEELMKFALFKAKTLGFDVFNSLDVMENSMFLNELKFGPGDGFLHYYLYNWGIEGNRLEPGQIGKINV